MSAILPFGTAIALPVPQSSAYCVGTLTKPKTVGNVLDSLIGHPDFPRFCSAANRFAEYLRKPGQAREIPVDVLVERLIGFRPFLTNRLYADNSIGKYRQLINELLEQAKRIGWVADETMPPLWRALLSATDKPSVQELIRHFSKLNPFPGATTLEQINCWVDGQVIRRERSFGAVIRPAWDFERLLVAHGYITVNPIRASRLDSYGIPLSEFPEDLKREVEALIAYRKAAPDEDDGEDDDDLDGLEEDDSEESDEDEEGRPKRKQIRAKSAELLEASICRLYGYLHKVKHRDDIKSLKLLFHPRCLRSFRKWLKRKRKLTKFGLRNTFMPIFAAIRQYPLFAPEFSKWFKRFMESIPEPTETERREKKSKKYLEYRAIEEIPDKIRSEIVAQSRRKCGGKGKRRDIAERRLARYIAELVQRELLMRWILILPWRQRNLRECRVCGPTPNLFKGPIPAHAEVDRPAWVAQEEARNPKAEFWQYSFSAKETKTGKPIHCVLPFSLIKPLEDYVHNYRQILVGDKATETLYVGEQGAPLNSTSIRFLICELALSYGGKRLTPHIFRDIFAFEYLKNRPLDFVTLSIQLWHASVNTTMKYYAGRFNASCGTAAVESWLEQRRAKYNSLPGTVSKTVPGSAHTGALTNNSVVRHHNRQRSMK